MFPRPLTPDQVAAMPESERQGYLDHFVRQTHDLLRGLNAAWAAQNVPRTSLAVVGGAMHAFAGSTSSTPMPRSERRAIIDGARRGASYVAGGAR